MFLITQLPLHSGSYCKQQFSEYPPSCVNPMESREKPENRPSSSEPSGDQVKTDDLYAVNEQTYQKPGFRRGRDRDRGGAAVPGLWQKCQVF